MKIDEADIDEVLRTLRLLKGREESSYVFLGSSKGRGLMALTNQTPEEAVEFIKSWAWALEDKGAYTDE